MFTEEESRILDIAYETFITKEYALRVFSEKNPTAGYESWAVHELILSFWVRGIKAYKRQVPDLIVNDIKLEFKAGADLLNSWTWMKKDFEEHPDIKLHLFVAAFNEKGWDKFVNYLNHSDIEYIHKNLGQSNWKVVLCANRRMRR